MLYAAYGSNLHPERLLRRTPSAEFLGTARVGGLQLEFHKRGRDGSGKCSIAENRADTGAHVFVAVYALSRGDSLRLDRIEGVGSGYAHATLAVPGFGRCLSYRAEPGHVDDSLQPFDWYRELVLLGCHRHAFPAAYRAAIEAVGSRPDPDALRRARHRDILAAMRAADSRQSP